MANRKIVIKQETGRLDKVLSGLMPELSRSRIAELIEEKNVLVNGQTTKNSYKVMTDDLVDLQIPEVKAIDLKAQPIDLDIIYEDQDLLVVNKPAGMVVHPSNGHQDNTLVNGILAHAPLSTINGEYRPGIVHRLDKDTSGLLMVAKNDASHLWLSENLKAQKNDRIYYALVHGLFDKKEGTIDAPIARHKTDRKKQAVDKNGKPAVTHFKVVEEFKTNQGDYSLVKVQLETGRTHQIRVHFNFINHPVAGDPIYGPKKSLPSDNGQYLHAAELSLIQPTTKEKLRFQSKLPDDFEKMLEFLRSQTID